MKYMIACAVLLGLTSAQQLFLENEPEPETFELEDSYNCENLLDFKGEFKLDSSFSYDNKPKLGDRVALDIKGIWKNADQYELGQHDFTIYDNTQTIGDTDNKGEYTANYYHNITDYNFDNLYATK